MANSSSTCNGSNLNAYMGLAHNTNTGCGVTQDSNIATLSDPYSPLASNIPTNLASSCNPQLTKSGSSWSGGNSWSGAKTLTGTASVSGNTLVCGDVQLTGDVTVNAPNGAVLYIQNGRLDLNGHTFKTNGSSVTLVFTGDNGSYVHAPVDLSGGSNGVLDFQAPTSGPFPGMAIYQDPKLTTGVDVSYSAVRLGTSRAAYIYQMRSSQLVAPLINLATADTALP